MDSSVSMFFGILSVDALAALIAVIFFDVSCVVTLVDVSLLLMLSPPRLLSTLLLFRHFCCCILLLVVSSLVSKVMLKLILIK